MPQTIWKGALSFGLVNVPISLVSTTRKGGVAFRQLHKKDHAPIRQDRVCTECGERVEWKDLEKGAEIAKDTFVPVSKEEIEAAEPDSSRAIAIREFVTASDLDPVYRESSYALAPQAGGERAYALLQDALARRNEVAIGTLALRNREHVVAVRAGEKLLFVDLLHYKDEVRDLREIEETLAREGNVSAEEKELADMLLEKLHKDWDPAKYHDAYEERLRALIAAKSRGETFHAPSVKAERPTADLLSALRETLKRSEAETETKPEEA